MMDISKYRFDDVMGDMERGLTFHIKDKKKITETVLYVWQNYHGNIKTPKIEVKYPSPNMVKVFIDSVPFVISWE
jgi:hypothetical protein